MVTQLSQNQQPIEQMLMETVKIMHPYRVAQVLDFARWLQTQPDSDEAAGEALTLAEIEAEEDAWQAAYMQNKDEFRAMAQQALSDLDAGQTLEMVVENGKIRPR